jgi:hypothetical protein
LGHCTIIDVAAVRRTEWRNFGITALGGEKLSSVEGCKDYKEDVHITECNCVLRQQHGKNRVPKSELRETINTLALKLETF